VRIGHIERLKAGASVLDDAFAETIRV